MQECIETAEEDEYDKLFLHVFAPVLTEFTEWVLTQALRDGKKRLYFLARDGYLMYHAARQLVTKRGYDLELRYLKVSRYSMRSAQYHLLGRRALDFLCAGGLEVTFETVMKRGALTEQEAHEIAKLAGYENRYGQRLDYRQLLQLKEVLRQIPQLFKYLSVHALSCRESAAGYLMQEGLTEDVPCALVDSGWIGTLQQSIGQLAGRELSGYYFGLYELPEDADARRYRAFYFMPGTKLRRKVYFSNCLFETVCSAPEGMTLGYEKRTDETGAASYVPIESAAGNPGRERIRHSRELLERYVLAYSAEETFDLKQDGTDDAGWGRLSQKLLMRLMGSPESFEAELLGSLPFCDDVLEFQLKPVAAELTGEEQKRRRLFRRVLLKSGILKGELPESAWPEASAVNSGGNVRRRLFGERLYKYFIYIRKAMRAR